MIAKPFEICAAVLAWAAAAAGAETLEIGGETYAFAAGFAVGAKGEAAGAADGVIGLFAGHPVRAAAAPGYDLRPALAYMQKGSELKPDAEGVILTGAFVARCADPAADCAGAEVRAAARVRTVNERFALMTIETDSLDAWRRVYGWYETHRDDFATFRPVIDRGRALRIRDEGLFTGENGLTPFAGK